MADTFITLTDAPGSYANSALKLVRVNETESALVFSTLTSTDLANINYVGSVLGTTGQVHVSNSGINGVTSTISLVATGVTAAVYGNATHVPQLTVDTYGRISNVDMVQIAAATANGNVTSYPAFSTISVSGQPLINADTVNSTLNVLAGTGVILSTNGSSDSLTIGIDPDAIRKEAELGEDVEDAEICLIEAIESARAASCVL
jgi:hypothetical protein